MWVPIYKCMEATLGISLYSYLSQTRKSSVFLIIAYVFSPTKLRRGRNRFCLEVVGGGREVGTNNVYTCK
jgi:hypothetical protein